MKRAVRSRRIEWQLGQGGKWVGRGREGRATWRGFVVGVGAVAAKPTHTGFTKGIILLKAHHEAFAVDPGVTVVTLNSLLVAAAGAATGTTGESIVVNPFGWGCRSRIFGFGFTAASTNGNRTRVHLDVP